MNDTAIIRLGLLLLGVTGAIACVGRPDAPTPVEQRQAALMANGLPAPTLDHIQALAAGTHTCALLSDGTVRCWGDNTFGQVGNGNTFSVSTPVIVPGLSGVVSLASGAWYTCVALSDGTVRCWGANSSGQLGDGTTTHRSSPVAVPGLSGVVAVAAGWNHTCALRADRTATCWGANQAGQLGVGNKIGSLTPMAVGGLTGIASLVAGGDHTCATFDDRTARCWGENEHGELGIGGTIDAEAPAVVQGLTTVTSMSPGAFHMCATIGVGSVRCWGDNTWGQLGRLTPGLDPGASVFGFEDQAVAVTSGYGHSCAQLVGGGVRCWGLNLYGAVGNGGTVDPFEPAAVAGLRPVTSLVAGLHHTCALLVDGTARCWGAASNGALGHGGVPIAADPLPVPGLSGVVSLSTALFHTCALLSNRTVRCWGDNGGTMDGFSGQLGNGQSAGTSGPVAVPGLADVVALSSGEAHTCALLGDGTARCWGLGDSGQLGDGNPTSRPSPVAVAGLSNITSIATGYAFSCAVLGDGTARCWGDNSTGALGDGTQTSSLTPVAVSGLADVVSIAAGGSFACALLGDGHVRCWGQNNHGQLGDHGMADSLVSVLVPEVSGASALVAGQNHACALAGGKTYCWGDNREGQSAAGGEPSQLFAAEVASSALHVSLASRWRHTCAVTSAGGVDCWGANMFGQLGDRERETSDPSPSSVGDLSGVTQVSVGWTQSCALLADGTVSCWGDNRVQQLGSPNVVIEPLLVTVLGEVVGQACGSGAECPSGACVDGVCCDDACGDGDPGDCQACAVAAGATADGVCAPTPGYTCREAADACDVADTCSGGSLTCPADVLAAPAGTCGAANPGTSVPVVIGGGTTSTGGMSLTFTQVAAVGNVTKTTASPAAPPPTGYQFVGAGTGLAAWDLSTTTTYSGSITICFNYAGVSMTATQEANLKLMHDDGVHQCQTGGGPLSPWCNITTSINTITKVICGSTLSLSPFALMVPVPDTDAPILPPLPTVLAYATSAAGATVTYAVPTATDARDGDLPATCVPASGSSFPLGQSTVTCTATDESGNVGSATFTVWVKVQAPADGTFFGQPINGDGSSIFKGGSTIPVKFRLTGASAGLTNLVARLTTARVSNAVSGSVVEADSSGAANTGNLFRYEGGQYVFNLSTKGMANGTWSLRADLGDGVTHQVAVSLR